MTEITTMMGSLFVTVVVVISTKLLVIVAKVFSRSRSRDSSGGGIVPIIPETSSSSSSSTSWSWKYDVFLSFRGEDTRKTFVDHLYSALFQHGILTYKDDVTLDRGVTIGPALSSAIRESQIALIVFSKNYADSSWCLDELSYILKCKEEIGQIVMPIFYDVDPSDVRKQKGQFGKAFAKHKLSKNNIGKIETWTKALVDASNIAGWEPKHVANGHEAKCIQEIVDSILVKLSSLESAAGDEDLVGMGTRLKDLKRVLRIGSGGVRMVGIWGVGGGGKTTLATSIFMQISAHFDGCCFVENIREESKQQNGLKSLQEKILSAVFDKKMQVESVGIGKHRSKGMLCRRNVLIVLDDVDDLEQLEALAGRHDWFGDGSRIIITTRNKQLLISHRVDEVYPVSLLSLDEAIQLFRRHAYHADKPVQDYEKFSLRVISYVNGLPLALKILGSFLYGKDKNEWMSAMDKLKHIPNSKVTDQLRISYDGLDRNENELFFDIACFYRCNYKDGAMEMLDACGFCPAIGVKEDALGRGCISSFTPPVRQTDLLEAEAMHTLVLLNTVTYPTDPVRDIIYRSFDKEYDITHHVFRWDTTSYEQVFANGFLARRQENVSDEAYYNLEQYVNRGGRPLDSTRPAPHCFVSTTLDSGWYPSVRTEQGVLEVTRYEIYAPGGIWVAETLGDRYRFRAQDEVAFVNGIAPQYIRSAQLFRLQASGRHTRRERVNNIIHINGGFDPQLFYADERMPEIRSPIQLYENPTTKRKENLIVQIWNPPHMRRKRETNIEYVNYKAFVDDGILINAAFRSSRKYRVYVFMKNEYAVINYAPGSKNDRVVVGPHLICHSFPSLSGTAFGEHGIDCAFTTHYRNECFIFSGNLCAKIDYAPGSKNDKILKGPMSIFKMFSFFKGTVFETGVDAAFESSTKDEAYLFKGNQYALINYSDNEPKLFHIKDISEVNPSLKGTIFDKGIDAAFASHLWNEAYIFKGDTYARINFTPPTSTKDYVYIYKGNPNKILPNWPSLNSILPRPNDGLDVHDHAIEAPDRDHDELYVDE